MGILSLLPPEAAHNLGVWLMRRRVRAPGRCLMRNNNGSYEMFGTEIDNPLGLAAGFDKNGVLIDAALHYGFGFIEIGSVTADKCEGNPKPRMFRLDGNDIGNRMGLNNDGVSSIVQRLVNANSTRYGVSITKTNNSVLVGDKAIDDIAYTFSLMTRFGMYTCLNISCPNTERQTFEQAPAELKRLLAGLQSRGKKKKPLLIKLSPPSRTDVAPMEKAVDVCEQSGIVDGYVCCNTLPELKAPRFPGDSAVTYGRSGAQLQDRVLHAVRIMKRWLPKRTIIACGGIFTPSMLRIYCDAGADFFQAYNGFVRGPHSGPKFAHDVLSGFDAWDRCRRHNDQDTGEVGAAG